MKDLIKNNKEVEHLKYKKPVNQIKPLVSVIVLTYNHENYIEKCLRSIISQKVNFNFEIIIGEDESNDKTRQICLNFANRYKKLIRLFLRKREDVYKIDGVVTGKYNSVASQLASRGKYIAFCDGDDFWVDTYKLQKQVDFLKKHKDCSYVFTRKKVLKKDGTLMSEKKNDLTTLFDLHYLLKKNIMPSTQTIMFTKNALPKKMPDLFWNAFNGDWILLFLLTHKSKIGFINEETAVYRQDVGIISKTKNSIKFKNGLETNKALNKLTNYKYDYHLGKKEWFYENICFGFLKEGKKAKGLSKVIVKLFYSLKENNFENFITKNIIFFKHITKLTFKKTN